MASFNQLFRCMLTLLLLLTTNVNGFFPSTFREVAFGMFGTSHESQTKTAFETLAKELFPEIPRLTKGMLAARDAIAEANQEVDDDQDHSALHFDGENINGGMKRLVDLKAAAKASLMANNGPEARKFVGQALHTLQDFYAHSNWIEMGNGVINPKLGNAETDAFSPWDEPTCNSDCGEATIGAVCRNCIRNMISGNLTTGYYFGEDSPAGGVPIPSYKCHHGGATDNPDGLIGVPSSNYFIPGGINKDSMNCRWSPHWQLHTTAADLATKATVQYIREIVTDLNDPKKTRLLFGLGVQLAFAIDTTASMGKIIDSIKAQVLDIIQKRVGTPDEPISYILAPFNDPTTGPVTATQYAAEFTNFMSNIFPSGGGDCPELAYNGMLDALAFMQGPGELFLFTDAPPKDFGKENDVWAECIKKDVRPHVMDFLGCEGDNLSKRASKRESYKSLAARTGGSYHALDEDTDLPNLGQLLDAMTKSNNIGIHRQQVSNIGNAIGHVDFPVDSTITELTLHYRTDGDQTVSIADANGSLNLNAPNIHYTVLSGELIVTVTNPTPGPWFIEAEKPGHWSIDVFGVSNLQFSSFNFVAKRGRPGHTGYMPIKDQPAYDHLVAAVAGLHGEYSGTPQFNMRTEDGNTVATISTNSNTGGGGDDAPNSYWGTVQLSAATVRPYCTGVDSKGFPFQRYHTKLFTPIVSGTTETGIDNSNPWAGFNDTTPANSSTTTTIVSTTSTTATPTLLPTICPEDKVTFPPGPPATCVEGGTYSHNGWAYVEYCKRGDMPHTYDTEPYGSVQINATTWDKGNMTTCLDFCSDDLGYSDDIPNWQCLMVRGKRPQNSGCARLNDNFTIPADLSTLIPRNSGEFDYAIKLTTNPCVPSSTPTPRATSCPTGQTFVTGPPLICEEGKIFTNNGSTFQSFCNRRRLVDGEADLYSGQADLTFAQGVTRCSSDRSSCNMIIAHRDGDDAYLFHNAPSIPTEKGPYHYAINICPLSASSTSTSTTVTAVRTTSTTATPSITMIPTSTSASSTSNSPYTTSPPVPVGTFYMKIRSSDAPNLDGSYVKLVPYPESDNLDEESNQIYGLTYTNNKTSGTRFITTRGGQLIAMDPNTGNRTLYAKTIDSRQPLWSFGQASFRTRSTTKVITDFCPYASPTCDGSLLQCFDPQSTFAVERKFYYNMPSGAIRHMGANDNLDKDPLVDLYLVGDTETSCPASTSSSTTVSTTTSTIVTTTTSRVTSSPTPVPQTTTTISSFSTPVPTPVQTYNIKIRARDQSAEIDGNYIHMARFTEPGYDTVDGEIIYMAYPTANISNATNFIYNEGGLITVIDPDNPSRLLYSKIAGDNYRVWICMAASIKTWPQFGYRSAVNDSRCELQPATSEGIPMKWYNSTDTVLRRPYWDKPNYKFIRLSTEFEESYIGRNYTALDLYFINGQAPPVTTKVSSLTTTSTSTTSTYTTSLSQAITTTSTSVSTSTSSSMITSSITTLFSTSTSVKPSTSIVSSSSTTSIFSTTGTTSITTTTKTSSSIFTTSRSSSLPVTTTSSKTSVTSSKTSTSTKTSSTSISMTKSTTKIYMTSTTSKIQSYTTSTTKTSSQSTTKTSTKTSAVTTTTKSSSRSLTTTAKTTRVSSTSTSSRRCETGVVYTHAECRNSWIRR